MKTLSTIDAKGDGRGAPLRQAAKELSPEQVETLRLYSERQITGTEAKKTLDVDRWGLLELMSAHASRADVGTRA